MNEDWRERATPFSVSKDPNAEGEPGGNGWQN